MNDADNLALYSQILLFKNDPCRESLSFSNRSTSEQRVLQAMAHSLSLEYEYSVPLRTIRISRPHALQVPAEDILDDLISDNFDLTMPEIADGVSAFDYLDFDHELSFDHASSTLAEEDTTSQPLFPEHFFSNIQDLFPMHPMGSGFPSFAESWDMNSIEEPILGPEYHRFGFIPEFPSATPSDRNGSAYNSRRRSVRSASSSVYQEMVFDSRSMHSSQGSIASDASGRRGPLSGLARAGMNAVRKVGACWRCKVLRKSVGVINLPLCYHNEKTPWKLELSYF